MEKSTFIDKLINFGLTRQEAIIYQSLLENGKSSGYEIAKITGISRSNTYNSLSSLTDKGAAYIVEEGTTKKYIPITIKEFCSNYINKMAEIKKWLEKFSPIFNEDVEGYITIKGEENIKNKILNMLDNANERVYITCSSDNIQLFAKSIQNLLGAKKRVVLITDNDVNIQGAEIYICEPKNNQIGLIADSKVALTGEIVRGQ